MTSQVSIEGYIKAADGDPMDENVLQFLESFLPFWVINFFTVIAY